MKEIKNNYSFLICNLMCLYLMLFLKILIKMF
nr:MAG TPA: hypothetical protein [Caudoviricetes sp.]